MPPVAVLLFRANRRRPKGPRHATTEREAAIMKHDNLGVASLITSSSVLNAAIISSSIIISCPEASAR